MMNQNEKAKKNVYCKWTWLLRCVYTYIRIYVYKCTCIVSLRWVKWAHRVAHIYTQPCSEKKWIEWKGSGQWFIHQFVASYCTVQYTQHTRFSFLEYETSGAVVFHIFFCFVFVISIQTPVDIDFNIFIWGYI